MAPSHARTSETTTGSASAEDLDGTPPAGLVESILADPPAFPGWSPTTWRRTLGSVGLSNRPSPVLSDPRVGRLLAWAARRTDTKRQMGAVAAALATLDRAVHNGDLDAAAVVERIRAATEDARPLMSRSKERTWADSSTSLDGHPAASVLPEARAESPLAEIAVELLRHAGFDLQMNAVVAGRLTSALDVAVDHWLQGAERGGGLPEYRKEHTRFYGQRLIVKLGADRDLLRLIAGPQPGKGRGRQVAWQRGLAYWVAVGWAAREAGDPLPPIPSEVVAHWRKEIDVLVHAPEPDVEAGLHSRYAATP